MTIVSFRIGFGIIYSLPLISSTSGDADTSSEDEDTSSEDEDTSSEDEDTSSEDSDDDTGGSLPDGSDEFLGLEGGLEEGLVWGLVDEGSDILSIS